MPKERASSLTAGPIRLRRYTWLVVGVWTLAVAFVLTWELIDERNQVLATAQSEAVGAWKRETAGFRWVISRGSLYVPTENASPNPHLADIPDRDITSPSGRELTIVSPPTVMDQIHRFTADMHGYRSRISSLQPVDPKNAPDPWEKTALETIAKGEPEVVSVDWLDGSRFLRLMRPLVIDETCLVCHAEAGHKVGDLRGGLSISIRMASVWGTRLPNVLHRIFGYGGMWVFGLVGIGLIARHLQHQISKRQEAEYKLREANDLLEQRVAERTAELATANTELQNEIADRRQAEQWLLESEQRFRGYFEQGLIGMAILSADREWVEINQRLCQILGYTEAELFIKPWVELLPSEDRSSAEMQFQRLVNGVVGAVIINWRLVRKDRQCIDVDVSVQCMRKQDKTVDCILLLVQQKMQHSTP